MNLLEWPGPSEKARLYWTRGGPAALVDAVKAGQLDPDDSVVLGRELVLIALEEAVDRLGFERLRDVELDKHLVATQMDVLAHPDEVPAMRRLLVQRWMHLRWLAHGRSTFTVSPDVAREARGDSLMAMECAAFAFPRMLHLRVPLAAELALPDGRGGQWPVTDILLSSEEGGQRLRLLLEAPWKERGRQSTVVSALDWPQDATVAEAFQRHGPRAVPGVDWQGAWRLALAGVLAGQARPAEH
jgi:hypothetical protein